MSEPHATKRGPGRQHATSTDRYAPRTMAQTDLRKLPLNVGREPRREWRAGEPMHIIKPVRAARKAKKAKGGES